MGVCALAWCWMLKDAHIPFRSACTHCFRFLHCPPHVSGVQLSAKPGGGQQRTMARVLGSLAPIEKLWPFLVTSCGLGPCPATVGIWGRKQCLRVSQVNKIKMGVSTTSKEIVDLQRQMSLEDTTMFSLKTY